MLETALVAPKGSKKSRRLILLPVSIGLHAILIGTGLFAAVWHVSLPTSAPNQMSTFDVLMDVPLPPPGPPQQRRAEARPVDPVKPDPTQVVTPPDVIPDQLPDLTPAGDQNGSPNGAENGTRDGDPNGSPDGIVGGFNPDPTTAIQSKPVPVGPGVVAPRIIYRVDPRYPEHPRRIRLQGYVMVRCVIDRTGGIRDLQVVSASHPAFAAPAIEALRQWRFTPGLVKGQPADTEFVLKVNFTLN
jgi:periplasmic protein TonB